MMEKERNKVGQGKVFFREDTTMTALHLHGWMDGRTGGIPYHI